MIDSFPVSVSASVASRTVVAAVEAGQRIGSSDRTCTPTVVYYTLLGGLALGPYYFCRRHLVRTLRPDPSGAATVEKRGGGGRW
jgi:hypothetical protein